MLKEFLLRVEGDDLVLDGSLTDSSGNSLTGETVTAKVQRPDGFYWNGTIWVVGVNSISLTEIGSTGQYVNTLTNAFDTGVYKYTISWEETGPVFNRSSPNYTQVLDSQNILDVVDAIKIVVDATFPLVNSLEQAFIKASGTAGGGTSNTIILQGASVEDDYYKWDIVTLDGLSVDGGGQSRLIIAYDGGAKTATVFPDWITIPPTPNGLAVNYTIIPGQLRSIYSLDGISLPVDSNIVEINSSDTAATNLSLWADSITTGFINEATPPTNGFEVVINGGGTVTEGQLLIMQDASSLGPGEARAISSDLTASGVLTLDKALRAAPVNTDAFIVLPAGIGDDLLRLNTELTGAPAITDGLKEFIKWVFHLSKVKLTETATLQTIRNSADSGDLATRDMSDDGTTFTSGEAT